MCRDRFRPCDYVVVHSCGHACHIACTDDWNRDNQSCLVCKARALKKRWAGADEVVAMMEAERGYIDY